MATLKIKDLPNDQKVSKEEMKKILGGYRRAYTRTGMKSRISPMLIKSASQYQPFISPIAQQEEEEEIQT